MEADDRLAALATLNEPVRRRLYDFVAAQPHAVGRDQASESAGVPRSVAAFHLDKLADAGLLEVEFRRPPGKSGPGAGRPAKLYRRAAGEISLSVPERHYDLAGVLLARGVATAEAEDIPPSEGVRRAAREHGREVGRRRPGGATANAGRRDIEEVLRENGYEPFVERNAVVLANCPFHAVAEEQRDLVCGMNLAFLEGVLDGLGATRHSASLEPAPGRCCVTVRPR